tara:strand:- start:2292 stop:2861 length:570 start_codon:yes stop_codon:yes gene_type:complete
MKTSIFLFLSIPFFSFSQNYESMKENNFDLINPNKNIGLNYWNIVNDDVMGGVSKSFLSLSKEKKLVFNGYLSLENNGGFASSRLSLPKKTLTGVKSFQMKLRGDGKIYKLRLRQNNRRASYSCDIKSVKDEWIVLNLNLDDFKPYWRGYSYNNYPAVDIKEINSLGIQISDKQEGEFKLEIEYIKAIF